jgi:NitT/TauT family transport system substrate-binding protein
MNGSPRTNTSQAAEPAPSGGAVDPLAPYASKPGDLPTIKFAQDIDVLSFAPAIIARDMNFFGYQGVKLEFIQLQSGTTSLQAMVSGSIDLVNSGSTQLAQAVAAGAGEFQAIENTSFMTLELCVREDWAHAHNVTRTSSLDERMSALKGAIIGITGPGADSDRNARLLLHKYGDLDPNRDVTITQIGGGSALQAGMDKGQIDAFILSPPSCQATESGMVLVPLSEVPDFKNFPFHILYSSKDWLEAHKNVASAVATAVAMGGNFIATHPEAALELLQKNFSSVDPTIIANAFNGTIKSTIPPNGKFDASMWEMTSKWLMENELAREPLNTEAGGLWTNEYIDDASVK